MGQAEVRHVHPKPQMGHVLAHIEAKVASMGRTKIGQQRHRTQVSHALGRVHIQAAVMGQAKVGHQILVGAQGNPRMTQKTAAVVVS